MVPRRGVLDPTAPAGRRLYSIHLLVSELVSKEQLLAIWDELPERIISVKPTLGKQVFW